MSDRLLVATRKGLFTVERRAGRWQISATAFLADNVTLALPDARTGAVYVALNHGHFGVKLHRSLDGGASFAECGTPALPEDDEPLVEPMGKRRLPATVTLVWALAAGGTDQPGVLWAGTIPGALFCSADGGATWTLVESLWRHPGRREWFGGGADYPGIHSICVDPRDSKRVVIGVSCGGVWTTLDGGGTWTCTSHGMRAAFMPPERARGPSARRPARCTCRRTRVTRGTTSRRTCLPCTPSGS